MAGACKVHIPNIHTHDTYMYLIKTAQRRYGILFRRS